MYPSRTARMAEDALAEDFFDEKIAPGLRTRGIEEERLATVRAQFIADVISARAELAGYSQRIRWIEGLYVTKSGKLLTEADIEALSDEAEGK